MKPPLPLAAEPPFDLERWLHETRKGAPIVQAGALVLRQAASEVPADVLGTPALDALVTRMVATMRAAPGVGLAGPQVGVPWRIFVAEDNADTMSRASPEALTVRARTTLPLMAAINPVLTKHALPEPSPLPHAAGREEVPGAPGTATFYEGCLSVRGYGALVTRAFAVSLRALTPRGEALTLACEGWPARILQHETDHLDGTLYVDRMVRRSFVTEAELGRWGALPFEDVLHLLGGP